MCYILEALLQEHGDLEVETNDFNARRVKARAPFVGYKLILLTNQSVDRFWASYVPGAETRKGEKVIKL